MHFRLFDALLFLERKNIYTNDKKDGVVAESIVCKWFAWFRSSNFDLEDRECSGRPVSLMMAKSLIKNNSCHTTRKSTS